MTVGIPADDPRTVWQNQTRENQIMSADEIRMKARATQAKVRRNLIAVFTLSVLLLFFCLTTIAGLNNTPIRLIAAAFMVLTCVVVHRAYVRLWSRASLSPDVSLNTCVEFYRRELANRYRSVAIIWRFLVPIVLFAFFAWNAFLRTNPLVPRILLPTVLVLILLLRRLEVGKYKRQLAALDEFEKGVSE